MLEVEDKVGGRYYGNGSCTFRYPVNGYVEILLDIGVIENIWVVTLGELIEIIDNAYHYRVFLGIYWLFLSGNVVLHAQRRDADRGVLRG